jgi:hypothetical protein
MKSAKFIKTALLALAFVAIVIAFVRYNRVVLPEGPVPVVWDREVCTHCKMHVGDPRFAAQLQAADGRILNFDDPGCLFDYLDAHQTAVHAVYFRNHEADGWLSEADVGFLPVDDSPMGYGIRAVPKGTAGAHGLEWAKARAMNRPHDDKDGS